MPLNKDCASEFLPTEDTTHFQRNFASFLQNNMNKSLIKVLDQQNQDRTSSEEQQLSALLLTEFLKFQNSEKAKELLCERFGSCQLKDPGLNCQRVLQIDQKRPITSQRLDRSISEPVHQLSVAKKLVNQARYKTELCRQFEEKGHCQYGEKCQFAHGKMEKRSVERHPKYKTEMCRTFHQQGFCSYGLRCNFIHNEDERRFAEAEESSDRSMIHGRLVSPSSVFEDEYLASNSDSSSLSGHLGIHELARSMSVVETRSENLAFSNESNTLLPLNGLVGMSTERIPYFQASYGPGVSVIVKDQKSRGRPILSRSVSSAVHLPFNEDHAV